jgi:hypothetical protein
MRINPALAGAGGQKLGEESGARGQKQGGERRPCDNIERDKVYKHQIKKL